jgi:uncharacterized protein YqcC (DUF446 family)
VTPASVVLKAYYERLYERMEARRAELLSRVEELLAAEVTQRGFPDMDEDKLTAYREACVAFIDERLESYNPIGIQYTFGTVPSRMAAELEFELNWHNSRPEFAELVATARSLAAEATSDEALPGLADELIRRAGAFPDRSIIDAYLPQPTLQKLPDYIVACVIEEIVCGRKVCE